MFCRGQEVLFSYNAIKILGKTRANQTPLDKILNHHAHTPLQTLWAFLKNIFVLVPFDFLPSFLLSK